MSATVSRRRSLRARRASSTCSSTGSSSSPSSARAVTRRPGRSSRLYARHLSVLALSRIQFPRPELGELFVSALQHRSHLVDGFPGFHRLEVLSPARADGDYVLATWWDTREDLKRWLRSDEHAETHARTPAAIAPYLREARVEIFEVRA